MLLRNKVSFCILKFERQTANGYSFFILCAHSVRTAIKQLVSMAVETRSIPQRALMRVRFKTEPRRKRVKLYSLVHKEKLCSISLIY